MKSFKASVFSMNGKQTSEKALPEALFSVAVSPRLLAQYIRVYLANQGQGTKKTKNRGEVTGSTRKIYRQKGTGRARHAARKAPIFVGGGVAFGPRLRTVTLKLNKKQIRKALLGALTEKASDSKISILNLVGDSMKTKDAQKMLQTLEAGKRSLLVYSSENEKFVYKAAHNLEGIMVAEARTLNAYETIKASRVIFTEKALDVFVAQKTQ